MPSFLNPQWMLLYGLLGSYFIQERPVLKNFAKTWSKKLLQVSIILLGSKLSISQVIDYGSQGAILTFISLSLIFLFGMLLKKLFKIDSNQSLLISAGTAICGGSAIAAVASTIAATSSQVAMAMGVVFLLNAVAIFIFPAIGHGLGLSQSEFGQFCALAIHDTSSVVAAASLYGQEALSVATTYKLTRALWIIPMTLLLSMKTQGVQTKVKVPLFIVGFLICSLLFSFTPFLAPLIGPFAIMAKIGLSLTLFLIGLSMDYKEVRKSGLKSFSYALTLWLFTIFTSLGYILL